MADKPLPKHFIFTKWLINIRWVAVFLLVLSTIVVDKILKIGLHAFYIYILSAILLFLNLIYFFLLKYLIRKDLTKLITRIKQIIHFQISADIIILTLVLHYSGGIENPLIIYYIFHMIIASSILSPVESYLQTGIALLLVGVMAFLECYGIIPHYHLEGFISQDIYNNKFYLFGGGFIFIITSLMIVSMMNSIVSTSRKNEEAFLAANVELEQKDKMKDEYIFRVTHDIKGHLAAISSCLKVVKTDIIGRLNEQQLEFINRAYERTDLLTHFVKDLLNLTKKRLKNDVVTEEFSIKNLIDKVVNSVQILAKDKLIKFDLQVDENINTMVGNPFSIEELLSNLLLNAIKYTPENGRIQFIVRNRFDQIIGEVSDTGIGIPPDEISKVFDEFFRASNVSKDSKSGSGLGLSIVKQIVENHKGRIWVESKLGIGTKFTFSLPKHPDAEPAVM